jgi:16S rRNA (cytosine967-C5)-methyltransferase
VGVLAETIRQSGLPVPIVRLDARQTLPFPQMFDLVILDVPCSGLGTLRRDPDLKWSRQMDDLPALAAEEGLMLQQAAEVVRPGGRLVYATCSSEPEENEAVVAAFMATRTDFVLLPPDVTLPGASPDAPFLRTTPVDHGLDAFFAAVLVRNTAA